MHAELSIPQDTLPSLRASSHPSLQHNYFKGDTERMKRKRKAVSFLLCLEKVTASDGFEAIFSSFSDPRWDDPTWTLISTDILSGSLSADDFRAGRWQGKDREDEFPG